VFKCRGRLNREGVRAFNWRGHVIGEGVELEREFNIGANQVMLNTRINDRTMAKVHMQGDMQGNDEEESELEVVCQQQEMKTRTATHGKTITCINKVLIAVFA